MYSGLGTIRCIFRKFGEYGPLEGGVESSLSRGAKGDFRVIWSGFLAHTVHFRRGPPTIFRKHMPWGIGTETCFRWTFLTPMMYIRGEWAPLEGTLGNSLSVPAGVPIGGFLTPTRAFSKGNPYLFRKHMPWAIRTAKLGMIRCIFVEKWHLDSGFEPTRVLMVIWSGFLAHSKGAPHHFQKAHALRYRHRNGLGLIGCIFAGGPLEGGGFLTPTRAFSNAPHHFPKAKFGDDQM